jgi:hypothetical protein
VAVTVMEHGLRRLVVISSALASAANRDLSLGQIRSHSPFSDVGFVFVAGAFIGIGPWFEGSLSSF